MEQPLLMPGAFREDTVEIAEQQRTTDLSMGFDGVMEYAYHDSTPGPNGSFGFREQLGDDFMSQYQPAVNADSAQSFDVPQSADITMSDEDFTELLKSLEQEWSGLGTEAPPQQELEKFVEQQPSFDLDSLKELQQMDCQPPSLNTHVTTEDYSFNLPPIELNFAPTDLNMETLHFDIPSTDTVVTAPGFTLNPTPFTLPLSPPTSLPSIEPYIKPCYEPTMDNACLAFKTPSTALSLPLSFNQIQQPAQPPQPKRLRFIPAITLLGALRRGDPLLCLPKPVRARIFKSLLADYSVSSYIEMPDTKDLIYPYFVQYSDRWYSETCEILLSNSLWSLSTDASLFNLMVFLSEFDSEDEAQEGWTGYGTLARLEFTDAGVFRPSDNGFSANATKLLRQCTGLRHVIITFALADLPFLTPRGTGLDIRALLSTFSLSILAELPKLQTVEFKLSPYMAQHKALMSLEAERLGAEAKYKRAFPGLGEFWGLKGWLSSALWQRQGRKVEVQGPRVEEFVVVREKEEMEGERKRIREKGMVMGLGMGVEVDGGV